MPLKTAIIGFGRVAALNAGDPKISREYAFSTHAEVLRAHPSFDWGAVVDSSKEAVRTAREIWGIDRVYHDVAEMLEDYRPDIVSVCTRVDVRAGIVALLGSVKAIMLEKPIGRGRAEVEEISEFCRRHGLSAQVNFWRRGDTGLRGLAAGGLKTKIGRTQAAFGVYGNGLRNNGAHLVDFLRMQFGEIEWVEATGGQPPIPAGPVEGDVQFPFAVGMTDGLVVEFQPVDFRHYRENAVDLWGETGRLSLMSDFRKIIFSPKAEHNCFSDCHEIRSDKPEIIEGTHGRALYEMYDNIARHLSNGDDLYCPLDDAAKSEMAIDVLIESAGAKGKRISLTH